MAQEMNTLKATTRSVGAKSAVHAVRREGLVPGVVYGHDIKDVYVTVDPGEFETVLNTDFAYNVVFNLEVDGKTTYQVMAGEIQFNSVRRTVTHVDFKVVRSDENIVVDVPVVTTGTASGVVKGGRLELVRRDVKVATTVENIPLNVSHDVSALEIGDQVYVDEMVEPEDGKFEFNHRFPVIRLARPRGTIEEDTTTDAAPAVGEDAEAAPAADA